MASTAASTPKRQRTGEPSGPPAAVVERFSSFINNPDADILLRSVDGWLFATRRAFLVAASSVFDDMLGLPQSSQETVGVRKDGQAAPGVLQLVEMTETCAELEPFLRWIHRDTFEAIFDLIQTAVTIDDVAEEITWLLSCADKYDVKAVSAPILSHVGRDPTRCCAAVLALGVIYKRRDIVERAIRWWMGEIEGEPGPGGEDLDDAMYNVRTHQLHNGNRPWSVANIWPMLLPRLPVGFFLHIAVAEREMLFSKGFTVEGTVEDFLKAFDAGFPLAYP